MLPLGETIGISMMGAVFTNKLKHYSAGLSPEYSGGAQNLAALDNLPGPVKEAVQNAAARSVMWALITVLPFVGLSIIASAFLGNVWIGVSAKEGKKGQAQRQAKKGYVMYGVYLLAALKRTISAGKEELDVNVGEQEIREKVADVENNNMTAPQTAHIRHESH